MRYIFLAMLITGSAAMTGCGSDDDDHNVSSPPVNDNAVEQAKAELAVSQVDAVINASRNLDTDEPQDISRIVLPEANLAEPVKVKGANASL